MDMQEESAGGSGHSVVVIKGKRSKRRRPRSWPYCAAAVEIAGVSTCTHSGGGANPSTSTDDILSEEDKEELVGCLMLLAKGINPAAARRQQSTGRRRPVATIPAWNDVGCRTSHKKVKLSPDVITARNPPSAHAGEGEKARINTADYKGKAKTHYCSICGVQFSSGQALGGHMTRHRTTTMPPPATINQFTNCCPPVTEIIKKNESTEDIVVGNRGKGLLFDVNIPAIEDGDHRHSNSGLESTSRIIVFPASD